ncbi:MAG: hypothetical protein HZC04_01990 [Candidatus Lloydbacteria bacterium]|nr:hypothetical protein [Candidatus Lloydbacteria bacterium]
MASWSTKRQLLYLGIVFGTLLLIGSFSLYKALNPAPSCTDGKQNQNETGIDCGGVCSNACVSGVLPLITLWSRVLPAGEGAYDAAGFIENPNLNAGIPAIAYTFKLYDKDNILVAEKSGKTFVNPNERFTLFESGIETGRRIPLRAFLEFQPGPQWKQSMAQKPPLVVQNKKFTSGDKPLLEADVVNRSFDPQPNVIVVATLFDSNDNVFAASKTVINRLVPDAPEAIFFTWPKALSENPARIEIVPRVSVFSGR